MQQDYANLAMPTPRVAPRTQQPAPYGKASLWRETVMANLLGGQQEAFSIGPDGYVWSYTVNAEDGRTGRLMSTGLAANTFTLGRSGDGLAVVIAAEGSTLRYVAETGSSSPRWSAPCVTSFPGEHDALAIEQILVQTLNGNLFLGLLTRHRAPNGTDCYRFWDAVWAGGGFVFCHKPAELDHGYNIWMDELASKPIPL